MKNSRTIATSSWKQTIRTGVKDILHCGDNDACRKSQANMSISESSRCYLLWARGSPYDVLSPQISPAQCERPAPELSHLHSRPKNLRPRVVIKPYSNADHHTNLIAVLQPVAFFGALQAFVGLPRRESLPGVIFQDLQASIWFLDCHSRACLPPKAGSRICPHSPLPLCCCFRWTGDTDHNSCSWQTFKGVVHSF